MSFGISTSLFEHVRHREERDLVVRFSQTIRKGIHKRPEDFDADRFISINELDEISAVQFGKLDDALSDSVSASRGLVSE